MSIFLPSAIFIVSFSLLFARTQPHPLYTQMGTTQRSFKIQAFRSDVRTAEAEAEFAEKSWKVLEDAFRRIYAQNASSLAFEDLYRCAYSMVLHKHGEMLYSGLVNTMTSEVKQVAKSLDQAAPDDVFLQELLRKWHDHTKAVQMFGNILMYMDRTFVPTNRKMPVRELGLVSWRDNVVRSGQVQPRLLGALLELIRRERTGEEVVVHGELITARAMRMFMELGAHVYQEDFEKLFLDTSGRFYSAESQRLIECCGCGAYLENVERRVDEEIARVSRCLDAQTEAKIVRVVEKEMIENQMLRLVSMEDSGLVNMLVAGECEGLSRMYRLLRRVPEGLPVMLDAMAAHLREVGKQLDDVQLLSDEKDEYRKIIDVAFDGEECFHDTLNSCFE